MTTVAKIVTRLQGDGDGLFIGSVTKAGLKSFKPNTVYEIVDILGVLAIREVGRATGAGDDNCVDRSLNHEDTQFHWGTEIGDILNLGGDIFLTTEEYREELKEAYEKNSVF